VRLVGYVKKKSITMHGNMNLKLHSIIGFSRRVEQALLLNFEGKCCFHLQGRSD